MTERSRETWAFLTRWLVLSVLLPYSAHLYDLYDIFSTDDVTFISQSIMIEKKINLSFMFVTCLPPRYSPQIDTNEKSCSFAFGTFRSISQRNIGIKFHNTVLHVPFSLSLLFLLVLSHNAFFLKKIKEKRKIQQTTNLILVSSMWWRDFTRMPGMNEKDIHHVLARDYFSDSWLVRFWQYLAHFSNKDYRNHIMKLFSPKLLGPN